VIPELHERIEAMREEILESMPADKRQEKKARCYAAARAAAVVTLQRTEQIIDELEAEVKQRMPRVTHITLEVEGITSPTEIA
jgi:zinc transporter 9